MRQTITWAIVDPALCCHIASPVNIKESYKQQKLCHLLTVIFFEAKQFYYQYLNLLQDINAQAIFPRKTAEGQIRL